MAKKTAAKKSPPKKASSPKKESTPKTENAQPSTSAAKKLTLAEIKKRLVAYREKPFSIVEALKERRKDPRRPIKQFEAAPAQIAKAMSWPHPDATSPLPTIVRAHKDDEKRGGLELVVLRDGFLFELCADIPLKEQPANVEKILRHWLDLVPGSLFNSVGLVTGSNMQRYVWDPALREIISALVLKGKASEVAIEGPEAMNPALCLKISHYGKLVIKMRWPRAAPWQLGLDQFVSWHTAIVDALEHFSWARCGPTLFHFFRSPSHYSADIVPDHPGWDIERSFKEMHVDKLPNLSWLTFVGDKLLAKIGGDKALQKHADQHLTIETLKAGQLIRLGAEPWVELPKPLAGSIKELSQVLEPVTDFSLDRLHRALFEEEAAEQAWLRRFLTING